MTTTAPHGYGRYSRGCRCGVCRAAKAAYSRSRRSRARTLANLWGNGLSRDGRHFVPNITHGRYGYEERGCRCDICLGSRAKNRRDRKARHLTEGLGAA